MQHDVYVQGELGFRRPSLPPPRSQRHVYCSPFNPGARELMVELAERMELELTFSRKQDGRRPSVQNARQLLVASEPESMAEESWLECDHFLIYLNGNTWTQGEPSEQLAAEVSSAMDAGVHLLCAHEMPGVNQETRHPCEFGTFFQSELGALRTLVKRGIFHEIAVPLKGGEWRQTSMVMLMVGLKTTVDSSPATLMASSEEERAWLKRVRAKSSTRSRRSLRLRKWLKSQSSHLGLQTVAIRRPEEDTPSQAETPAPADSPTAMDSVSIGLGQPSDEPTDEAGGLSTVPGQGSTTEEEDARLQQLPSFTVRRSSGHL